MILFFGQPDATIFAVQTPARLTPTDQEKLTWLFGNAPLLATERLDGYFVGPRAAMITPWSTNAVEITQNMVIAGIERIEEFRAVPGDYQDFDPMLAQLYRGLDQRTFTIEVKPEPIRPVSDIAAYNEQEGLALSEEEVAYLADLANRLGRPLTDSEVFGFSQVNSEHCRHKIFNGRFVLDGKAQPYSLFQLIKQTSRAHPNGIVSAYKDNVAFLRGPVVEQFAPTRPDVPDYYAKADFDSVLSLKAETHNFPTTVEPFNGAATGSGGEIRDRMAGGQGSIPMAGTAVYMTAYSRLSDDRPWEQALPARPWLYQRPIDILIKASNGASDFGNKFGQPLIAGSVLTFEHAEHDRLLGYDKVIMLAGGIGYGKAEQSQKERPATGDRIVVMGGENYRIGMGGAAVSSADTGEFSAGIELNAVQRSNPEMQKRVANAVRGLVESAHNPIVSIHDHGAGGHLNCLSELVEETGGKIDLDKLPVGDPTLSAKEIIGNESQERMGLVIHPDDMALLNRVAERERAPLYTVGNVTGDHRFTFESSVTGAKPMDLALADMFGSSPKTVMEDRTVDRPYAEVDYDPAQLSDYLRAVLQLEAVACKDWLTNKVDRCVGGRVAKQQCAGPLQLPLNNVGVMALDFNGQEGMATAIGHAPLAGLVDPAAGSRNAVVEALTNIVWAPLRDGLRSVSLSANWMWPCRNPGEDARLYRAVEALSDFVVELGINVPTGKDSLSMKQKYPDGREVLSPGTVIVSAGAHCDNIRQVVEPVLRRDGGPIYYIDFSGSPYALGGSSFAQVRNKVGNEVPTVRSAERVRRAFDTLQALIRDGKVLAGHDVASGGLITTLLELCFADRNLGADLDLTEIGEADTVKLLFAENAGVVFQATDESVEAVLRENKVVFVKLGQARPEATLTVRNGAETHDFDVAELRQTWYRTSYLLDRKQTTPTLAEARYRNYAEQPLRYAFPDGFAGTLPQRPAGERIKAAIIREKGSNSEREMAHALYLAGFDVKDVHMTDLIAGRETLEDIRFIGAVGGFSNSDVLGSAKGWAGAFRYNERAREALERFFARPDTLSVGICNGCQLFIELDLVNPEHAQRSAMRHNDSAKHESAFTSVVVQENNSVMLSGLAGTTLGVWISHGEGKFHLPEDESAYHIVAKYGYAGYPANPNGSDYNTAMLCSADGRHLVTMPHIERSIFPWNWAHYPAERTGDDVSPWVQAFVAAREWLEGAA